MPLKKQLTHLKKAKKLAKLKAKNKIFMKDIYIFF